MSPLIELTEIVADAQKQSFAAVKELGSVLQRTFDKNVDLAERILAYQRNAFLRYAGAVDQSK